VPTACPGGRAPHLWLGTEQSLYDALGFEFTLLRLGREPPDGTPFEAAAKALGIPLTTVHIAESNARDLYQADLALIRPDQRVVGVRYRRQRHRHVGVDICSGVMSP
jgi:hypothetical protein